VKNVRRLNHYYKFQYYMSNTSPGLRFRNAVAERAPLQVVGAINAYTARMAEAIGHKALYLSGGGVAANSLGLPDLGISTLEDVVTDVERITSASDLPLLVDADTGFGGAFNIARTVRTLMRAGAAGMHIEVKIRWRPKGAVIVRAKPSSLRRKWLIASSRPLMHEVMMVSSSWLALTPWRLKGCRLRLTGQPPV
jgi:isocitrate lyase